ncbi:MAG: hypothetical protein AAF357_15170, partial [Verrucomicrobiota bacterium]
MRKALMVSDFPKRTSVIGLTPYLLSDDGFLPRWQPNRGAVACRKCYFNMAVLQKSETKNLESDLPDPAIESEIIEYFESFVQML